MDAEGGGGGVGTAWGGSSPKRVGGGRGVTAGVPRRRLQISLRAAAGGKGEVIRSLWGWGRAVPASPWPLR